MLYKFGPHELDSASFELRRSHWRVRLAARPMELLLLLVCRRGVLVSREEIASSLWPGLALDDLDSRINTAIGQIRAALNDDAARPRYLETVIGKGYRFIHAVEVIDTAELAGRMADQGRNELSAGAGIQGSPSVQTAVEVEGTWTADAGSEPAGQNGFHQTLVDQAFADPALAKEASAPPAISLPAPASSPRSLSRMVFAGAFILAAAAALSLFYLRVNRETAGSLTMTQITSNDSDHPVGAAALSPDGQLLAYTDPSGLYLRQMQTGRTRLLNEQKLSALRLAWFRDGSRLILSGYEHEDARLGVWIVSAAGGDARLIRQDASDGAPSPDGRTVAFTVDGGQAIHIANIDGTGERTLAKGNADRVFSALFWPWSGKRISYQQRTPSGNPATEIEMNYEWSYCSLDIRSLQETALERQVPFDSAEETAAGWLYFLRSHPVKDGAHNGLWKVNTDPATGAFKGAPERLAPIGEKSTSGLSMTADGKQLAIVRQNPQPYIYVAELVQPGPSLKNARRLTSTLSSDYPYSWSGADDAVYIESSRVSNLYHLFRQPVGTSNAEMLTFGEKQQFFPTLMPDGRTLVYEQWATVNGQRGRAIYRANADGTNGELVWKERAVDEWRCPLLRGSTCILRETEGQHLFVFYALDLKGGKGKELARSAWEPTFLGDWALSPDGTTAAIPDHDPNTPSIRLVPLDGSKPEQEIKLHEAALLSGIHWSTNAQGFYVEAQIGIHNQLQFINLMGDARVLREATGNTWGLPSRDGKKLAFSDSTISSNVWLWQ